MDGQIKFAVRRQLVCNQAEDFLSQFARDYGYPIRLYSSRMAHTLEEVEVDWVITQCVRYHLSADHAVILKLLMVHSILSVWLITHHLIPSEARTSIRTNAMLASRSPADRSASKLKMSS